jgi:hypothetical protein
MTDKRNDYNWEEWQNLNEIEKRNIFNHVWDAFNPEIGHKTKNEIVDNFIQSLNFDGQQYGIKCFGWNVYMLFVIVDNSKIRVPKNFGGLSVNKGVILKKIDNEKSLVKFSYGGTLEINLKEKIIIG